MYGQGGKDQGMKGETLCSRSRQKRGMGKWKHRPFSSGRGVTVIGGAREGAAYVSAVDEGSLMWILRPSIGPKMDRVQEGTRTIKMS